MPKEKREENQLIVFAFSFAPSLSRLFLIAFELNYFETFACVGLVAAGCVAAGLLATSTFIASFPLLKSPINPCTASAGMA
jgi:hypothetical protein